MSFLTTLRFCFSQADPRKSGRDELSVSSGRMSRKRKAVLAGKITAVLSVPLILMAYPSNPPAGETGAAVSGGSTCGTSSCHFHGTTASTGGVTAVFPATYTPGGPAMPITVTLANGSGGFELSSVQGTGTSETQAGSFTAATNTAVSTLSGIQYIFQTATATSFSFTWTPPATNVGTVTMNLAGVSGSTIYANTYTLTPAITSSNTLSVSTSSLTFNYSGASVPASQTFQVSSSGASLSFTTSASTTPSGGTWLSAAPPGGTTPMGVTVSVDPTGLAAGTYTGSVSVAATGASNSPQSVSVTLNVTGGSTTPSLMLSASSLTFTSNNGGSASPQSVHVSSSGTAIDFNTTVATTAGGTWLSVSPTSGTTPTDVSVMVAPSGLTAGSTYTGTVTFTPTSGSASPQVLHVTLAVSGATPPPGTPPPLSFNFYEVDKGSGGSTRGNRLLINGSGSIDSSGHLSGHGNFTIYTTASHGSSEDASSSVMSMGTWTATGVVSYAPVTASGGDGDDDGDDHGRTGGTLTITVRLATKGGGTQTGTLKIANTGTDSGVTLSIDNGATFVPSGIGRVSIRTGSTTGGSSGGRGDN